MDSLIGQTVGNYEIVSLLGEGGMATVYRARQTNIRREVAFKIIRSGMSGSADFVERFAREVQTVATLNHPHILKVFDFGQVNGAAYLVMELQAGGSLATLIDQGPLDTARAATLIDQIASALDYAHRRGVIHRDLKPQNILLDTEGNAILTDFGIAKVLNTAGMTQTGMTVGTPTYMAPEQWQGLPLDARADEYALGIVLYQMLSGKLPFNGDTPFAVMHKHIYDAPPSIIADRPDLPLAVDMVIKRAMAKNRDDRFATAGDLAAAFRAALQGQTLPATAPMPLMQTTPPAVPLARTVADIPVTAPASQPRERGGWVMALIGLLAVVFFVFGAVLIYSLSRGPAAFAAVTTPTVAAVALQPSATKIPNTTAPTKAPPTIAPSAIPPTKAPPTVAPTQVPPTIAPTLVPSVVPTNAPVVVAIVPTATTDTRETQIAIAQATLQANTAALNTVSAVMTANAPKPTTAPTVVPTVRPTNTALPPTVAPTNAPTAAPAQPTNIAITAPTVAPTIPPTIAPTTAPGVGSLTFANFAKEAYLDSATLTVTGFPLSGENLQYDVWLSDRIHAPLFIGKLPVRADGSGRLTYNDPRGANLLLTYSVVFITLQGKETTPQGAVSFSGAVPPLANVHFQHVLAKFPDTPKNVGLIIGALQQDAIFAEHIALLNTVVQQNNLVQVKFHLEHLFNILMGKDGAQDINADRRIEVAPPGDGFGLFTYLTDAVEHANLAAEQPDASDTVKAKAKRFAAIVGATSAVYSKIEALIPQAASKKTIAEAKPLVAQIIALAKEAETGISAVTPAPTANPDALYGLNNAFVAGLALVEIPLVPGDAAAKGDDTLSAAAPTATPTVPGPVVQDTATQKVVMIHDMLFMPATLTIKAGTSVVFNNMTSMEHTANADDGSFTTGIIAPGAVSKAIKFTKPGTYGFYCEYHGAPGGIGMSGVIVVQ